ncbi:hypothetical protein VOLCADRAFT_92466 [Volvox carteri f. nagariensis]|uniref:Uncharacterized protein n=1 Tax=Volvox carteri f. nagariensis TaxID=3068 RepID=D8TZQ7_VOLCA|nr:uncharacterized protein VOLCADRAFT_92466 [Volvox carteri f. nagariensis]EFJ47060.1 hypothetical protein VOLCADRAFT_92466 [Volvox carteri f. nagariensis]|eukprot:XP_002951955.1 hypothetical protein VOLCADRAFT_92466 [Volvox carteri f. nagariensis]
MVADSWCLKERVCISVCGGVQVLIRGKEVLPEALEAVKKLTTPDGRWRHPVVFMTNGGGVCEARKAQQLSGWLGVDVRPEQVILSHTPMRDLVPELAQQPVLVSGRGDVLEVARSYGFQRLLHTRDLGRAMPAATPFSTYPPNEEAIDPPSTAESAAVTESSGGAAAAAVGASASARGSPVSLSSPVFTSTSTSTSTSPLRTSPGGSVGRRCPVRGGGLGTEAHPIHTVLVMTDPDDWYRDAQLICDVLVGAGVATRTAAAAAAVGAPPVKLVFSNPGGRGTGRTITRGGHTRVKHITRVEQCAIPNSSYPLSPTPLPGVVRLAERLLIAQARRQGLALPELPPGALPFSGIYAVGDNPAADVRGANQAGAPWVSVLVRTGVFQGPGPNCDVDTARVAVDDVAAAVDAAMHHTRSLRWHSMRVGGDNLQGVQPEEEDMKECTSQSYVHP